MGTGEAGVDMVRAGVAGGGGLVGMIRAGGAGLVGMIRAGLVGMIRAGVQAGGGMHAAALWHWLIPDH